MTTVLVTGGARGIGLEVCRQLAADGMTVLLSARDLDRATNAAATLDGDVRPVQLDITDDASIAAAVASVSADPGALDVLVNNAAAFADWSETATTADLEAASDLMATNLFGVWATTLAFLPLLRGSAHGRIVNVASGAGSHGDPQFGLPTNPGSTSYGIAKAALNALTTKLAVELADSGILVNSVCPGLTATAPGMEDFGARPVPEGAASVAWGARLLADGPSGGFFRDGEPVPW